LPGNSSPETDTVALVDDPQLAIKNTILINNKITLNLRIPFPIEIHKTCRPTKIC
jgi:hypothetical protein